MSGFLLIARFSMDDVPIGLFPDYENALAAANMTDRHGAEAIGKAVADKVMGIDIGSELIALGIVEFAANGFPIKYTSVRDF